MKMIVPRYIKHLVAVSLVLAFPLSSLAGGQEQTEWALTQGGVVVPVARICALQHSAGQSFPTAWQIMTTSPCLGGLVFSVVDAAGRQFLQLHKRFALGRGHSSTLDTYVCLDDSAV